MREGVGEMIQHRALTTSRRARRFLGPAAGVTLLLLAGAACGAGSPSSTAASASASAATSAPAASTGGQTPVLRTSPSPEQLASVIAQVKDRIPMSFQPNDGHVRAFGDAVCTAFDQGKSAPEVKALVLQAASQLPAITVSPANAAFAVGTAVHLFCPGYSAGLAP